MFSQNKTIPFLKEKISIDGKLDERVWGSLPEITGFYNYRPVDEGLAKHQTVVKLFQDGEYLYVGVVYKDDEARIQTSTMKRDVSIGISDSFVLVLDTQNQQQSAYYFAVNSYGTQVDGLVERVNQGFDFSTNWNAVWRAATSVEGTHKIYEFNVPLKALNFDVNNPVFGIQMYTRDIKKNAWTILTNVKRNYRLFDLRFTTQFTVENLPTRAASKFALTPSLTFNYADDVQNNESEINAVPSLDVQYNITPSLKLDATLNPDFSQIDVDDQVTNLTRFSVFFPERRIFFLENADLFSNLGVSDVNPFYSRRIGAGSDIQFGLKLSGNLNSKTRIGLMNVQTAETQNTNSQNYTAFVSEYQASRNFAMTSFLINRQETENFNFLGDFNRVTGLNVNFKSDNNKWIGLANVGKSFNDDLSGDNGFYNLGVWYNRRGLNWNLSARKVDKNYLTDVGFTPRLFNYDAINNEVIREGYSQISGGIQHEKFYEDTATVNTFRVMNYSNNNYFDENGEISQSQHVFNSALFFQNFSSVYYVYSYNFIRLKYGFDPLNNGNPLLPDDYGFGLLKIGYNSASNQKFRYRFNAQKGSYYNGERISGGIFLNYQLLPHANLTVSYDVNEIDLGNLGRETFHLTRFTGEVFFNTRLNWTTYIQYNTQNDNFNINSRFQWEYRPLSYIYLVVTDNYRSNLSRTNWGVAFKMSYRFDF